MHQPPDFAGQYAALTETAGFGKPERSLIRVAGADARQLLQNLSTNDVLALPVGGGCETFWANVQGKVVGHGLVFRDAETVWIDTAAGQAEPLIAHLDRYIIREDVQLAAASGADQELLIAGPDADRLLRDALGWAVADTALAIQHVALDDRPLVLRRTDALAVPTFTARGLPERIERLATRLADQGAVAVDGEALEVRRVESGFPLYGIDISSNNLPQEVGRDATAICFTKGCYLGQETVARLDALGHVNWRLRAVALLDGEPPHVPAELAEQNRPQIRLTSLVRHAPRLGGPLAMGYVRRELDEVGRELTVGAWRLRIIDWPR